jgi:hypothetical protein
LGRSAALSMVFIKRVTCCNSQKMMPLETSEKPHQPKARKDKYNSAAKPKVSVKDRQFMRAF